MKENLVSNSDRIRMKKEAISFGQEGSDILIVNIKKEVERLQKERRDGNMSPYIVLNRKTEDHFKERETFLSFAKDKETGVYYGIVAGKHADGNPMWRRIQLRESETYNINNLEDAKTWIVLRMHPNIEGSPFQISEPKYKVFDEELEAQKELDMIEQVDLALLRSRKIEGPELLMFARYLKISIPVDSSYPVIESKVKMYAYKNPKKFNEMYVSESRMYVEVFRNALDIGIIKRKQGKGYFYGDVPLGNNETSTIKYLKEKSDIILQLKREVFEKDSMLQSDTFLKSEQKRKEDKENEKIKEKEKNKGTENLSFLEKKFNETKKIKKIEKLD